MAPRRRPRRKRAINYTPKPGEDTWKVENFEIASQIDIFDESNNEANFDSEEDIATESPRKEASNVELLKCAEYHWLAHFPRSIQVRPAGKHERACSHPENGWVSFSGEHIKVGLSLPLPPMLMDLLSFYGICLAQFTPNAIRLVLGFIVRCQYLGIEPRADVFRYFFKPMKACNLVGYYTVGVRSAKSQIVGAVLNTNPSWKKRYFFIRNQPGLEPLEIPDTWRLISDSAYDNKPDIRLIQNEVRALSVLGARDCTVLCSSEILCFFKVSSRTLASDQEYEVYRFVVDNLSKYDQTEKNKGEGPFLSHCGRTYERIPTMHRKKDKWWKIECPHISMPTEGIPAYIPPEYEETEASLARDVDASPSSSDILVEDDQTSSAGDADAHDTIYQSVLARDSSFSTEVNYDTRITCSMREPLDEDFLSSFLPAFKRPRLQPSPSYVPELPSNATSEASTLVGPSISSVVPVPNLFSGFPTCTDQTFPPSVADSCSESVFDPLEAAEFFLQASIHFRQRAKFEDQQKLELQQARVQLQKQAAALDSVEAELAKKVAECKDLEDRVSISIAAEGEAKEALNIVRVCLLNAENLAASRLKEIVDMVDEKKLVQETLHALKSKFSEQEQALRGEIDTLEKERIYLHSVIDSQDTRTDELEMQQPLAPRTDVGVQTDEIEVLDRSSVVTCVDQMDVIRVAVGDWFGSVL